MKIIAMGDVHGRNYWKQVANTQSFDKLILIGDYFDSFYIDEKEQIRNFEEIIVFKEAYPDKVILLIGNHDFHYMPVARAINETYSGYQDKYAYQISFLLQQHMLLLQMNYQWKNYLFTHAGITNTWLQNAGYEAGAIDQFINDLFKNKPGSFLFSGWDPYGDDITQSPLWVRPNSLRKDAYGDEQLKQVVGHTSVQKLEVVADRFFFIDTMGTSCEYLILENEDILVEKVNWC